MQKIILNETRLVNLKTYKYKILWHQMIFGFLNYYLYTISNQKMSKNIQNKLHFNIMLTEKINTFFSMLKNPNLNVHNNTFCSIDKCYCLFYIDFNFFYFKLYVSLLI